MPPRWEEKVSGSALTRETSSNRVRAQKPELSDGVCSHATGALCLSRAKAP